MNKRYFTRWLRSKQLPLLLSFMLVVMAAGQSLHEQLEHNGEASASCEYCILSQTSDSGLVPLEISLLISVADFSPAIFAQGLVPLAVEYSFSPRGPPAAPIIF
jgi:hypothetical protein